MGITIQRNLNFFNVKDFGAQGNGTTDDSTAIQNLINTVSAAGGGTVFFPAGTYPVSTPLVVKSNITFLGTGRASILKQTTNNFIFSQGASAFADVTFDSLTFIGSVSQTVSVPTQARTTSGPGTTTAIWLDGSLDTGNSALLITNIIVKNCAFRNISSLPLRLFGITGVTRVESCEFTNCKDVGFGFNQEVICVNNHSYMSADNAFSISRGNTKITCTGNTAELAALDGIWLSGFLIAGNATDKGPQQFSCTGNTIKNVGQSGIRLYDAPKYGNISGNFIDQGLNRGAVDVLTDFTCNGISVRGYPSSAPASPTDFAQQLTISNNTIRNAPRCGIYLNGCQGVKVSGNLILDVGTQFYANGTTVVGTNLAGMANPQNIGIFIDQVATVTDVYLENNTVIDQRGTPFCITAIYPFPPISGVTMNGGNVQNGLQLGPKLPTIIRSDTLGISTAGNETLPRWAVGIAGVGLSSGTLRLSYFRARKNETLTQIRFQTGATAAAATPTLVRYGLYSVDSSGNLTLVGSIASDTTIFSVASTDYTRTMTASVALIEGQIYAVGALVVTAAAAPTILGVQSGTGGNNSNDPKLGATLTAQTDLPSSITIGSLSTTNVILYTQVL